MGCELTMRQAWCFGSWLSSGLSRAASARADDKQMNQASVLFHIPETKPLHYKGIWTCRIPSFISQLLLRGRFVHVGVLSTKNRQRACPQTVLWLGQMRHV